VYIDLICCECRECSEVSYIKSFCKCDEGWREQRRMVKLDAFGNGRGADGCVEGVDRH